MRSLFLVLVLFAGQAVTMQDKPVVRLKPHTNTIDPAFGWSLLELSNAPATIYLPASVPPADANGNPWAIDVKNFGPAPVAVLGKQNFNTTVNVNQTVHILVNGQGYILKH